MTDHNRNFDLYSRYYDLLYNDKNYNLESEYIERLLRTYSPNAKDLLEFGSGTGQHACNLCERGYRVDGVELSQDMIDGARSHPNFQLQHGDMCDFFAGRTYDVVMALFHVISYQTSDKLILNALHNASKHLEPGGMFLFDVWYTPAVLTQRPGTRVKRVSDSEVELTRVAEAYERISESQVDVKYTIFAKSRTTDKTDSFTEVHKMRHFSSQEVRWLARLSGFKLEFEEAFLTGESPSERTWGVCFGLRRV